MSLFRQIRQDSEAVAAASEAKLREKAAAAASSGGSLLVAAGPVAVATPSPAIPIAPATLAALEPVEIAGEWTLPGAPWLPPVFRGLAVVQTVGPPMPFHGQGALPRRSPSTVSAGSVAGLPASTSSTSSAPDSTRADAPPSPPTAPARCPVCLADQSRELGGLLFWEQVGPARLVWCVECRRAPLRKMIAGLWLVEWDAAALGVGAAKAVVAAVGRGRRTGARPGVRRVGGAGVVRISRFGSPDLAS